MKNLKNTLTKLFYFGIITFVHRGIAQLVEYWSPKPWVVGSSPSAPAKNRQVSACRFFLSKPQAWHITTLQRVSHQPSGLDASKSRKALSSVKV